MSVDIIRGATRKPGSSRMLADTIANQRSLSGQLFIGYPTIATSKGPHSIDALLVSNDKGIIIFDLVEGATVCGYENRQDDSANKLEARLKLHRELMRGRELRIPIHTISFAPGATPRGISYEDDHPITNTDNLIEMLNDFNWKDPNEATYESALSAIEGISAIRKSRTKRNIKQENSRGAKLRSLENSIATAPTCIFSRISPRRIQNNPDIYIKDEIYADITSKGKVPFPIRFDYDARSDVHVTLEHPKSHLTLGQYKNCRIPVAAPMTPLWFIDFVLRNFYHTAFARYADDLPSCDGSFAESILPDERGVVHISIPA